MLSFQKVPMPPLLPMPNHGGGGGGVERPLNAFGVHQSGYPKIVNKSKM